MSKETKLLLVGMVIVGALLVYTYDIKRSSIKGVACKKASTNNDNVLNDNNNLNNSLNKAGQPSQAEKKPQISREQFVAFEDWPSSSNTGSSQPGDLSAQDINQIQQPQNNIRHSSDVPTPHSVLYEELKSTSELYKGFANQLNKQSLSTATYNARIRSLQTEYDGKIKMLFRKKQKLDAIQQFIDNGSITPEEGKMTMWRVVLPEEAIRALSTKPKTQQKERPPAAPAYGTVTGILYSNETPLVMIDGEIYRQGNTINGVKITQIHRNSVDFEYKGFTWTQNVNDPPSPNWP